LGKKKGGKRNVAQEENDTQKEKALSKYFRALL
jgi:hypothetical protein